MESKQTEQPQELGNQAAGDKTILRTDALYQYILETNVYPREPQYMKELRELTVKHPKHRMMTCDDQLQFLGMLLKLINAKNTMEIGVFTGYSLLATALALPEDGKILAIDPNREDYFVGLPVIEKAGVAHKIEFKESLAMPVLDQMIQDGTYHSTFDFAYVDADKANYLSYHERLLDLVKVGGLIVYDNMLWSGSVAMPPDAPMADHLRKGRSATLEVNKTLAADPRVEVSLLSIGDGVTLCRRIS